MDRKVVPLRLEVAIPGNETQTPEQVAEAVGRALDEEYTGVWWGDWRVGPVVVDKCADVREYAADSLRMIEEATITNSTGASEQFWAELEGARNAYADIVQFIDKNRA